MAAMLFLVYWTDSSWRYNGQIASDHWRTDLRADAAGYYIYLPGSFHYDFKVSSADPDLAKKTGDGFIMHFAKDRIITKYTYGVALCQLPFYLAAEVINGWGGEDQFSDTHHRSMELSALFYWTLGLIFLGLALQRLMPTSPWVAPVALFAISFGSNLFFYAFRMPGFSHIYSFFAVCMALYGLVHGVLEGRAGWRTWLFHFSCALLILIRPTDGVIVVGLYAWIFLKRRDVLYRPSFWLRQGLWVALLWIPQLLYWRYANRSWVMDSYVHESFNHLLSPQVLKFLFAPKNGWLPYSPVLLLLPLGIVAMRREMKSVGWIILAIMAANVYLCSAWHSWDFGCSYGARPMAQYMALVAIAFWALLRRTDEPAVRARFAWLPILILLVFVNYRASLQYDGCYFSEDPWDWDQYSWNIVRAFLGRHT